MPGHPSRGETKGGQGRPINRQAAHRRYKEAGGGVAAAAAAAGPGGRQAQATGPAVGGSSSRSGGSGGGSARPQPRSHDCQVPTVDGAMARVRWQHRSVLLRTANAELGSCRLWWCDVLPTYHDVPRYLCCNLSNLRARMAVPLPCYPAASCTNSTAALGHGVLRQSS